MSLSEVRYNASTYRMMEMTRRRFGEINRDENLTDADRGRLKEYYLEHCVTPRARKIIEKYLAEEADRARRRTRRFSSRHRDRKQ